MAVTLKEVAKMAGVSLSTASHAIRGIHPGKRCLSAMTIQKVREVAEQLGYRPNLLAAGLANSKTFTIGCLVPNLKGNFYERILKGITEVTYPEYNTLLAVHDYQPDKERKELEFFLGRHVDGVIAAYSGQKENRDIYEELQKQKMPLVLVDRGIINFQTNLVISNYFLSTYLAVEELVKLGHKNIIFATSGPQTENDKSLVEGFNAAAMDKKILGNVEVYNCGLCPGTDLSAMAENVIEYIRQRKAQATALLVERDWLAYEILGVCREKGIKVPDEISIIGIADSDPSALRCINLSSVRIELLEVGRKAAELLLKIINKQQIENDPIVIKPSVIMRKTTSSLK
jgi:DNA-binding LacI/PurR family transcriptional regulator